MLIVSVMFIFKLICSLIVVMEIGISPTKVYGDHVRRLEWEGTVRVCGGLLSDMLYDACGRSYSNFNEDSRYSQSSQSSHPSRAGIMRRHQQEGPATQCCKKACKVRELKEYCKDQSIIGKYLLFHMGIPESWAPPFKYWPPEVAATSTTDHIVDYWENVYG